MISFSTEAFLKRNITKPEVIQYPVRRRKPLLHHFVTNLIASFGEIVTLKKYAMFMFAFLLLLLLSGSYNLYAKDSFAKDQSATITRIDSLEELSIHQQNDVLNALEQQIDLRVLNANDKASAQISPFPSAERHVYLMNSAAQAFPYTVYLGGQDKYRVEELALDHYGTEKAVATIISANPNLDFNALKTGDRVYLPLVNAELLYSDRVNTTDADDDPDIIEISDEAVISDETEATEVPARTSEKATNEATVSITSRAEVVSTAATTTAAPAATAAPATTAAPTSTAAPATAAPTTTAAAPTTTAESSRPPASTYVVSASPEVVDMYVRIVAAESSPTWDYVGHLMIAQTIINRALNGYWGDLYGVLTARNQYDVYSSGRYLSISVTADQRQAAMDALNGVTAFERDVMYFCTTYAYSPSSWWGTLDHRATHGNTMFFAP